MTTADDAFLYGDWKVDQQDSPATLVLDKRIIRVGIEVNGQLNVFDGLAITAKGTKFANPINNTCEIAIANLDRDTRNYLLTECSPFNSNNKPKRFTLDAGRESYGVFRLYEGDFAYCTLGQSTKVQDEADKQENKEFSASKRKKPSKSGARGDAEKGDVSVDTGDDSMDIWVSFKCITLGNLKSKLVSRTGLPVMNLSQMAADTAKSLGVGLDFSATDKQLTNTSYTGSALGQVNELGDVGGVSAYIDDGKLVVKNIHLPLPNFKRILNKDSGMIGKPEITEQGVKVKFLIDPRTKLGGALEIQSDTSPAANGTYIIYKLSFDVQSRDIGFYYMAECLRYDG